MELRNRLTGSPGLLPASSCDWEAERSRSVGQIVELSRRIYTAGIAAEPFPRRPTFVHLRMTEMLLVVTAGLVWLVGSAFWSHIFLNRWSEIIEGLPGG